jgi:3'-(hydroxy)phthioceranyl-2'-palmitoyl(stearoyl)-2-O-sulfo-trehalose (hydroxy)phthioceranyltransferase
VDPARVSFLLVGDPEAAIKGCISVGRCRAGYGGKRFPADTRYNGTVFARQYDCYADAPNDPGNEAARNNRIAAKSHGGLFDGHIVGVHDDYTGVGLHDPTNRSTRVGDWTYMTTGTTPHCVRRSRAATDAGTPCHNFTVQY